MGRGRVEVPEPARPGRPPWPSRARWAATAAILFHALAVLAGALGAPPSSAVEREVAGFFGPYHQLLDQGDGYRYYSTAFPPTPIVTATLAFADGRPEEVVHLPERGLRPRLRVQRQLALAHGLMEDFEAAKRDLGDGSKSPWAHAFAGHLCRSNPGCSSVTLRFRMRLVPPIVRVRESREGAGRGAVDLDDEEFTTAPERIGVFPCDAS